MQTKVWLLGGAVCLIALGFYLNGQFSTRPRLLIETAETVETVEEVSSFKTNPHVRSQVAPSMKPKKFADVKMPASTEESMNALGPESKTGEPSGNFDDEEQDLVESAQLHEFDARIQVLMDKMDSLLSESGAGFNPSVAEDRQLAILELEREMQQLMRSANIPSITREGPNGWTVYADDEEDAEY